MNRRLGAFLVFLTGVALYGPTLQYAFTYDDVHIIANQPLLHSLGHWREILAAPWWKYDLYRPLTSLTFRVAGPAEDTDPLAGFRVNLSSNRFQIARSAVAPAP